MKRYLTLGAAVLMLSASAATLSYAAGWSNANGDWQYLDRDGLAVSDQWRKSGDGWYYLNDDGRMAVNSLIEDGDNTYYVDTEGRMATNRWVAFEATEDDDYDMNTLWYYFGNDGKAFRKRNNSFKKTVNDKTYVFDDAGVMLQGYLNEEGEVIDDEDTFVEAEYYCGQDGAMYINQWNAYEGHGGSNLESDLASRDYSEYSELWMYFGANGKKLKSRDGEKAIQRTINGNAYGFDENGIMLNWWEEVPLASVSNASSSNAIPEQANKYYSGYDGGQLFKNTWFWMYPSESIAQGALANKDDYYDQECSWWRTDANGRVIRNKIRTIGNKTYAFDDIGRMQTGFVLFDGKSEFAGQWDVDAWESTDFIEDSSALRWLAIEVADLYLFSPDELNDGSMQKGREVKVELADGVHTFGFDNNGKAYGNRCRIVKKNKKYYFNGLRLEANEDLRYGVVEVEPGVYKVVDTNGKVIDGNRKLVKDNDDCYYVIINGEFKAYVDNGNKPRWHSDGTNSGYFDYDNDDGYGAFIADRNTSPDIGNLPEDAVIFRHSNVVD